MEQPESVPTVSGNGLRAYERALSSLTASQREAVDSPAPAVCVLAGAGSGKTRVLTLRAARRIDDGSADADHTVVCTFTRKAAGELRTRLTQFGVTVAEPVGPGVAPGAGVRVGTLHQLALTLLRRHALDACLSPPAVVEHRYRLLASVVGDARTAAAVETEIGWAKARCLTPDTYASSLDETDRRPKLAVDRIVDHFRSYEQALARRRVLDLDDVLVRAADLVIHDDRFAEAVRWRYRHLSIDEFQDINPAQYRLIDALGDGRFDLFVVGDPNQAIYGWNGADVGLIDRLAERVPGLRVIRLDENHRSTPQVVAAATAALGTVVHGVPRSLRATGPMPVVTGYDDDEAEAKGVVTTLLRWADDGRPWSEQAVLARTNDLLSGVSDALRQAGIPFRIAPAPDTVAGEERDTSGRAITASPTTDPDAGDDSVEMATFHRAKGLEWRSVCVIGIEEGFVPIVHAATRAARDEERRLLYVALTRASDDLHCSWARRRRIGGSRWVDRAPSPWLAAVSRVSRTGSGRATPVDTGRRIAQLRAGLGR